MKKYYVNYNRTFANANDLFYTNDDSERKYLPDGAAHISRKNAERLCRDEIQRRKDNPNFAGYADIHIRPAVDCDNDFVNDSNYELNGYIWERVK